VCGLACGGREGQGYMVHRGGQQEMVIWDGRRLFIGVFAVLGGGLGIGKLQSVVCQIIMAKGSHNGKPVQDTKELSRF